MLFALSAPAALAAAPDVLFTQVDRNDDEDGDSYPAICADGVCRAAVPVKVGRYHACMVNAWVGVPGQSGDGLLLLSVGPCWPAITHATPPGGDVTRVFSRDRHGAASFVVELPNVTDDWGPPMGDFILPPPPGAFIRVDIVAPPAP
jgi:hypothetical protein